LRCTLLQPPIEDFYFTPHRASALGLEAAASILRRRGHRVTVFNFPTKNKKSRIPLPDPLSYLRPFITRNETGPVSFFHSFNRFGPSAADCAEAVASSRPDAVFLSVMAFCYSRPAMELAETLQHRLGSGGNRVPIIACGAGASVYPGYFLDSGTVDAVLPGEAEAGLGPLLDVLESGAYPNSRTEHSFGMPCIPPPEGDLEFPLTVTGRTKKRVFLAASATRGCEKSCSFCSVRLHHGKGQRKVPLRRASEEIRRIKNLLAGTAGRDLPVSINFEDDNLFSKPEYAFELIRLFKNEFPNSSFTSENGLDYLCLDEDIINGMLEAGFFRFNLSLGALKPAALKENNRHGDPKRLETIVRLLRRKGITPAVFFICGLKKDTPETAVETLLFLHRLKVKTGISLFYPVPGLTPLAAEEDITGMKGFHPQLTAGSSAYPWNESLRTDQLITAFRLARFNNLLLAGTKEEAETISWKDVPGLDPRMVKLYFTNLTSI
jgi:hypothetical protein